jgi:hypothetical protein
LCEISIFIPLVKESVMGNPDVSGMEKNNPFIGRGIPYLEQSCDLHRDKFIHKERQ